MFLYIYSIIQGIVQGITELLPISSTAHLKIVNRIIAACGGSTPSEAFNNMFDVVIQLGSILAFLVYFHEKLIPAAAFRDKTAFRKTFLLWFKSGIGVIPAIIAGLLFADYVENLQPGTMKYEVWSEELQLDDQRRIFLRNFISDILCGTQRGAVSLEDHRKTICTINAAYDSLYSGQPVKVEN